MRSIEEKQVNGWNKNNTDVSHMVHNIQNNLYIYTLHVNNVQGFSVQCKELMWY